jgi:hypothetical protein
LEVYCCDDVEVVIGLRCLADYVEAVLLAAGGGVGGVELHVGDGEFRGLARIEIEDGGGDRGEDDDCDEDAFERVGLGCGPRFKSGMA